MTNISYFIVSERHGSGRGVAGWLWLRVSYETEVELLAGAALPEGLAGAGEAICKRT